MPHTLRSTHTGAAPDSRQRPTVSIAWMYLLALVVTVSICVAAITVIVVKRPDTDNTGLVTIIIVFGTTQMTAFAAFIKGQEAKHVAKESAYRFDGRLDELLEAISKQKKLEGLIEGAAVAKGAIPVPTETPAVANGTPTAVP